MFHFVVRHLRWLARLPGAPQLFDALLLTHTALFHRERLAAMEAIQAVALKRPGLVLRVHRLGGIEFVAAGRELGHVHGNGLLDIHLGREAAERCVQAGAAEWHHVFGVSAWVSRWVCGPEDVQGALRLLDLALESHRSENSLV